MPPLYLAGFNAILFPFSNGEVFLWFPSLKYAISYYIKVEQTETC